jgi:hypothetical protein
VLTSTKQNPTLRFADELPKWSDCTMFEFPWFGFERHGRASWDVGFGPGAEALDRPVRFGRFGRAGGGHLKIGSVEILFERGGKTALPLSIAAKNTESSAGQFELSELYIWWRSWAITVHRKKTPVLCGVEEETKRIANGARAPV